MTHTSTPDIRAERIAVFAGSFNPFTAGHDDIVSRGLELFDRIIVAVGVNAAKNPGAIPAALEPIRELYAGEDRVTVKAYSGLTAEFARGEGACALLRGVRSVRDFEYERDMADINRRLTGIDTVLLTARPDLGAVSSSLVRELDSLGVDTSPFMPHNDNTL